MAVAGLAWGLAAVGLAVVDTAEDQAEQRVARVRAAVAEICGSPVAVVAEAQEQVCLEVVAGVSDQGRAAVGQVVAPAAEAAQREAAEERAQVLVAREEALASVEAEEQGPAEAV